MKPDVFQTILKEIRSGSDRFANESFFNEIACTLFKRQIKKNSLYREYCHRVEADLNPDCWQDICFLPIHAFKSKSFQSNKIQNQKLCFFSSGTTLGDVRSRHIMNKSNWYDAAIDRLFEQHFEYRNSGYFFASLIPTYHENPDSSLSYMAARISRSFSAKNRFYAIRNNSIAFDELTENFSKCIRRNQKILFVTTTLALIDYLKWLQTQNIQLRLPGQSRIMDTGGYKGRKMKVSRASVQKMTSIYLGIGKQRMTNEYGMTELSSQFYDQPGTDIKLVPSWCRVSVVDPQAYSSKKAHAGVLRVADLANVWSCAFIQTEDLARIRSEGFQVLGRVAGSGLRGCSIHYEELAVND